MKALSAGVVALVIVVAVLIPLRAAFRAADIGQAGHEYQISDESIEQMRGEFQSMSANGRMVLFRVPSTGELILWEEGNGARSIVSSGAETGALVSGDGTEVLYFRASGRIRELWLWQEGAENKRIEGEPLTATSRMIATPDFSRVAVTDPNTKETILLQRRQDENGAQYIRVGRQTEPAELLDGQVSVSIADGRIRRAATHSAPVNDVDGDGAADFVTFVAAEPKPLWRIFTTSGAESGGTQRTAQIREMLTFRAGENGGVPVVGDYNGDGALDFATFLPGVTETVHGGSHDHSWVISYSDPLIVGAARLATAKARVETYLWSHPGAVAVPADYDGDGATDLATFSPPTGYWSIALSGGGFQLAKAERAQNGYGMRVNFGIVGDIPFPADYDGDGRADLAVIRRNTDERYVWIVRPSSKNKESGEEAGHIETWIFGRAGDVPLVGDFRGNGKSVPALYRPATRKWIFRHAQNENEELVWSVDNGEPFIDDFDGDGKSDLAFFAANGPYRFVVRNSRFQEGGRQFFGDSEPLISRYTWGSPAELPAAIILRRHQTG